MNVLFIYCWTFFSNLKYYWCYHKLEDNLRGENHGCRTIEKERMWIEMALVRQTVISIEQMKKNGDCIAEENSVRTVTVFIVRSACATTWRWKSATDLAVGTVSQGQGRPSWGGVWRKPTAKPRSDEQKLHIRHTWNGRVSSTKQSPILPEFQGVNAADIWGEGGNAYPRRSCRCVGVDVFETKHSNNELQEVSRSHSTKEKNLGRAEQS